MAFITEFSVSGLAGQPKEIRRKLDRHLNVFFGLNGSGKTSLLKVLDSAMSNDPRRLSTVAFDSAKVSIYSEAHQRVFTHSLSRSELEVQSRRVRSVVTADGEVVEYREPQAKWKISPKLPEGARGAWSHTYLPTTRMYVPPSSRREVRWSAYGEEASLNHEDQINASFADSLSQVWRGYFSKILTQVSAAQAEGLTNILRAVLATRSTAPAPADIDASLAYERTLSFLRRQGHSKLLGSRSAFERRFAEDEQLRSVVSDIDEVERKIAAAIAPRSKLEELVNRLFTGGKSVHFEDTDIRVEAAEHRNIGLALLSSGEKQLLKLFVEVLRSGYNTVLIDEPEMSMHIDWQQELLASIRQLNPEAQLLVATHSPEIMADVEDDLIFRL